MRRLSGMGASSTGRDVEGQRPDDATVAHIVERAIALEGSDADFVSTVLAAIGARGTKGDAGRTPTEVEGFSLDDTPPTKDEWTH